MNSGEERDRLNVGIIGAGGVFRDAHRGAYEARDDVRIACIADPVAAHREAAGGQTGCRVLYEDYRRVLDSQAVHAVDVCVPHHLHAEVALAAFDAGKDVILEKPIALTVDEADRMMAAALAAGRHFYVALNQRFYPPHRKLKEIVESGEYGRPFLVLSQLIGDVYARMNDEGHWKGSWDCAGGGALADTGTHGVDLLLWWFGRPKAVSCHWGRLVVEPESKGDDNVLVTLDYGSMLAHLAVTYVARSDPWQERTQIYFTDASVHITKNPDSPMLLGRHKEPLTPIPVARMDPWWNASVAAAVGHFLDCLMGKAEPEYGPEAAREALEIILLAYRAADEGRTLPVPGSQSGEIAS